MHRGAAIAQLERVGEAEQARAHGEPARPPVAEDHRGEADVAAAAGLALQVDVRGDQGEEGAAEAGEAAGDGDRRVLVGVHVDAERFGRDRVLAAGAQTQAEGRPPQQPPGADEQRDGDDGDQETSVSRPPMMPARSETRNQWWFWIDSRPEDRPGTLKLGSGSAGGDCLGLPPLTWASPPLKNSLDRYCVTPSASRLMATPETMWSTPKVTVATAWSRPPRAPPTMPAAGRARGSTASRPSRRRTVPRIIMPSRPMLTTPARSDHRPARSGQPDRHGEPEGGGDLAHGGELIGPGDDAYEGDEDQRARDDQQDRAGRTARGVPRLTPAGGGAVVVVSVVTLMPSPPSRSWRPGPRARRRRAAAGAEPVTADEFVGDDDGDHDEALHDAGDLLVVADHFEVAVVRSRKAHSSAANAMPSGLLRPSRAIAMPVKPRPGGKSVVELVGVAEQRRHAGEAGDRARDQHAGEDHLLGVDAAGRGGRLGLARWRAGRNRSGYGRGRTSTRRRPAAATKMKP